MNILKGPRLRSTALLFMALSLAISGVFLSSRASAVTLPVVNKSGSITSNETWTAGNVYVASGVYVESGVTLTIQAGAIVKTDSSVAIQVKSGGSLDVQGSSSSNVAFTSLNDDSFGGDSNGDGASSGSSGNYTFIASYDGGHIDVQYASFQFARNSFSVLCRNNSTGELNLSDSTVKSQLYMDSCHEGSALIQRNHFQVSSDYPIFESGVDLNIMPLTGLDQNTFTGSGQHATIALRGGTVPSGKSWAIDGSNGLVAVYAQDAINVYGNLNVSPGMVVKVASGGASKAFNIVDGLVTANGSTTSPIVITSIDDDSIGGDTAGDGSTTASANQYGNVFYLHGGSAEASNIEVRAAQQTAYADCTGASTLDLTDSTLNGAVNLYRCVIGDVTLERNSFSVTNRNPVRVEQSDANLLVLDGANKNTFTGSGIAVAPFVSNSSVVPSGTTWNVGGDTGMGALIAGITVSGTVNIDAGVVVKAGNVYTLTSYQNSAINVFGTGTEPVVFTSLEDDSVGGDSGGDGVTSGTPNTNYWAVIRGEGGAVALSHAVMRYASNSVVDFGSSWTRGMLSISDSTINSTLAVGTRTAANLDLKRNTFETTNRYAIQANNIDPSSIVLSGSDKNNFLGSDLESAISVSQSTIASGNTWAMDASTGLDALLLNALTVNGTMNIDPGMNLKVQQWISVESGGEFTAGGTTPAPVVFTSANDDSYGGDSNGDGVSTGTLDTGMTALKVKTGGQADIDEAVFKNAAVAMSNAGTLAVSNSYIGHVGTAFDLTGSSSNQSDANAWQTDVEDATYGLYVGNYSTAKFRGSLAGISNKGVRACNWLEACRVDVTFTDWGSVDGPFPSSGALACGQAVVSPWRYSGSDYTGSPFNINNCDISTSPSQLMTLKGQTFNLELSNQKIDCSQGIQDACDAADAMIQCVEGAVLALASSRYPILGFAMPTTHSASEEAEQYVEDAIGAAGNYLNSIDYYSTEARAIRLYDTASVYVDIGLAYDDCLTP